MKHYNPETGAIGTCRAKQNCPFREEGMDRHFETTAEARAGYEAEMAARANGSWGSLPLTLDQKLDELERGLEAAKAGRFSTRDLSKRRELVLEVLNELVERGQTTDNLHTDDLGAYSIERARGQEELLASAMEKYKDVPREGRALIAGGLGGAGKSTILREYAQVKQSDYATVNPDDIKELMAERGMIPAVRGLTPMEASPLVHEEASHMSGVMLRRLAAEKRNTIIDITMAKAESVESRVNLLRDNGYTEVKAVFVDIEPDVSLSRSETRYALGMQEYAMGGNTVGGRILPRHVVKNQAPTRKGFRSKNAEVLVELEGRGMFTEKPQVFDNNEDGGTPRSIPYDHFTGDYSSIYQSR